MPFYTVTIREEVIRWVQVEADDVDAARLQAECDVDGKLPVLDEQSVHQEIEGIVLDETGELVDGVLESFPPSRTAEEG